MEKEESEGVRPETSSMSPDPSWQQQPPPDSNSELTLINEVQEVENPFPTQKIVSIQPRLALKLKTSPLPQTL